MRRHVESCDSSEVESESAEIGCSSCFSVLGSESKNENEIECEGNKIGRGFCFSALEIDHSNEFGLCSWFSCLDCASFHDDDDDNASNMSDDVELID